MNVDAILKLLTGFVLVAAVSACGEPRLRDLKSGSEGPDEFSVTPSLPLEQPESFDVLPQPTPGGRNITDVSPQADLAAALGGRLDTTARPPATDSGLVTYASRNGVTPDIRANLAAEDAEFRRRRGRFTNIRLFPEDRYDLVYEREILDPFATADALRRSGIDVPTAPPRRR